MVRCLSLLSVCAGLCILAVAGCSKSKTVDNISASKKVQPSKNAVNEKSTKDTSAKEDSQNKYHIKQYLSVKEAIGAILLRTNPRVIGFGEFHQQHQTQKTLSALERFRTSILPTLANASSDLVVETWVPKGCGKVEKKVIKEVDEVTERPKETENETVKLINDAKKRGVQPHILDVSCAQYEGLFDTAGEMDFLAMLELVGELLGTRTEQVVQYRKKRKEHPKRILVYGGAIHNDIYFEKEWERSSFAPKVKSLVNDSYLAIDLYVPEFIDDSTILKEESWFESYQKNVSSEKVLLIEKGKNSYILIFKKGVKNKD